MFSQMMAMHDAGLMDRPKNEKGCEVIPVLVLGADEPR